MWGEKRNNKILRTAVLVLALSGANGQCSGGAGRKACEASDGCVWGYQVLSSGYSQGFCSPCSAYNTQAELCNSEFCAYNIETGECSAAPPPQPPAIEEPSRVLGKLEIAEGWAFIEMDKYTMSPSMKKGVEKSLAEALGADQVVLDEAFPIEAETCGPAPMCGDSDQMVVSVETYSFIPLPQVAACCSVNETSITRDCQSSSATDSNCRAIGLQEPFCPLGSVLVQGSGAAERCESLARDKEGTTLKLDFSFLQDSQDLSCCNDCTCYGDPNCVSFNGTETSWRLCDGRDVSDKCRVTESACAETVDHDGQPCMWIPDNEFEGIWKLGSQCQPSPGASPAWLLMYQADSFEFWIRQEERGVIREALMVTSSGNYSLSANDCFAGTDFSNSWEYSGSGINYQMVNMWKRVPVGAFDVDWLVFDSATKIQSIIRCTGTKNPNKNVYGNYRLDIKSLIEPLPNYKTVRQNLDGFCYTGEITHSSHNEDMIKSYYAHLEKEAECKTVQNVWEMSIVLDLGRQLCGSVTLNTLDNCFSSFCHQYSFPNVAYETCFSYFKRGHYEKGFCSVTSNNEQERRTCEQNIIEFGWQDALDKFFNDVLVSQQNCISDINDLPDSLEECQAGAVLQYQAIAGDASSWTDYKAIPETVSLCNNSVTVNAQDHYTLFTKPLRFHQCDIPVTCGTKNICKVDLGMTGLLSYTWDVPTATPTKAPTKRPTESPTPKPSKTPTSSPSKTPTDVPTPTPTLKPKRPTGAPSLAPTKLPTERPTDKPTESPTKLPTERPTEWPSKAPTKKPTVSPTDKPTESPTKEPTARPTDKPTESPTKKPTARPTDKPTESPTKEPTARPTGKPTESPTKKPTARPTDKPTESPTKEPTARPTDKPTESPTKEPTNKPTRHPTGRPSRSPTTKPTMEHWPTKWPTSRPTEKPTMEHWPTKWPTPKPSMEHWPSSAPTPREHCEPTCPNGDEAPSPTQYAYPSTDQCSYKVHFTASDLGDDYCGCDFSREGAINSDWSHGKEWNSIDFAIACPGLWHHKDLPALEMTCQLACNAIDECDAWAWNYGDAVCYLFTCDTGHPDLNHYGSTSAGLRCNPRADAPTPSKDDWRRALVQPSATETAVVTSDKARELRSDQFLFKVKFYATFESETSAEESVRSDMATLTDRTSSILASNPAFIGENAGVASMSLGYTYDAGTLRFPQVAYEESKHTSPDFLAQVCTALETTILKRTNFNTLKCGRKLFVRRAFRSTNGGLVVVYFVDFAKASNEGKIHKMLESDAGKKTLDAELKKTTGEEFKVLGAGVQTEDQSSSAADENSTGLSTGALVGIIVACSLVVLGVVGAVVYRSKSAGSSTQLANV